MKNKFLTIINQKIFNNIDINIELIGYEKTTPSKAKVSNAQKDYVIIFISEGNLFFYNDGKKTKLTKNDCFVFDPNKNSYYEIDKLNPPVYYWLNICGRECSNIIKLAEIDSNKLYCKIFATYFNKIKKILQNIFEAFENENKVPNYFEFNSCFYQIMDLVNKSSKKNNLMPNKKINKNHVDDALIYFSNHYTDSDFTLTKVANAIGLHKNYLGKLFRDELGVSFNTYLTNRRMNLAVYLIQQGSTSIAEIASKVGIEDQFYFSKLFKKYNKITPSADIKRHNKLRQK